MENVRVLGDDELSVAFSVVRELRTELSEAEFKERVVAARAADGYRLWGVLHEGRLSGIMGARVLVDLVHGRHLYVDDLVVAADGPSSSIRKILEPSVERTYAGYVVIRGTVPEPEGSPEALEVFRERFCFFHAPVS